MAPTVYRHYAFPEKLPYSCRFGAVGVTVRTGTRRGSRVQPRVARETLLTLILLRSRLVDGLALGACA